MPAITCICFDADDTLWHNERFYRLTQERFAALLAPHAEKGSLGEALLAAERRNIPAYGFGIKGFTLSMIETAVEITQGRVSGAVIGEIVAAGREMLRHPIEPLPHVRETLQALHGTARLVLITKGDLFDQERKLAQSGLGAFFDAVEIVSDKTAETYRRIFGAQAGAPDSAVMVGNSLKSDVLPAIAAGAYGVHVPHDLTFALEHAEPPVDEPRFAAIADLGALPGLLRRWR